VGSPGVLPQSDTEAFLWAKRAADAGLVKAMYATGYFYETGVGTEQSVHEYVSQPVTTFWNNQLTGFLT
jgi:TPR repeat protein